MTKRLASLILAIAMFLQIIAPQAIFAKEEVKAPEDGLVTVGVINSDSYDAKLMLELNRLTAKNRRKRSADQGESLFGYFDEGQEPKDEDKPKYHGEVKAKLKVNGLDGNPFQWNEIFGKEEVHLRFIQTNDETGAETGVERVLNINQGGTYTWTDGDENPAELPLFNNKLEPLTYEVKLDEEVSDKVKLLTARLTTTGNADSPTFEKPDAEGRIKYHLTLEIGLQQVASSKFVSEWHTAVAETERPQIQGTMTGSNGSITKTANFDLPKNDTDSVVIRTNSTREGRKPDKIFVNFLYKTPTTDIKTDTTGLTFDTKNKTVKSGDHKFKYDFKYDVIDGGKLTMTEILSVTFDANGGKFASLDETAEQKIVKGVEYDGTLTDKAENPTKSLETFKGWSLTKGGALATDADFANIKEAKTFYAIWDNNPIIAEELEVKESFKDGTGYVNDFIPTLDTLKGQVKIKDGSGNLKPLNSEKFAIVDGNKEYTADGDELKNYLYDLLQEKDNPKDEPTRVETVKAKVTFANGNSKEVTIPIKVIKNIYEAKTKEGKPNYVPEGYVKVTVDPTTKATEPQKYFYYVNPAAKVLITKDNPVGVGANTFVKWAKGTTEYKLDGSKRYNFSEATTITAEYTTDVIEQTDPNNKPNTVPSNFVKVTFKPTNEATDTTDKIYWVNPTKEVTFPIADPVGAGTKTFKEWKLGSDVYKPSTPKKFTDTNGTTITATYVDDVLPAKADESAPDNAPADYVKVTVVPTDNATDETKATKIFWVNPKKVVTLKVAKPVGKDVPVDGSNPKEFTWKFTEWKSNENGPRTWSENVDEGIKDKFPVETTITAQYEKVTKDQESKADELTVFESFKEDDATEYVNDFIPTLDQLKEKVKVTKDGTSQAITDDEKFEIYKANGTDLFTADEITNGDLKTYLYDKLKEKTNDKENGIEKPSRIETVKAKVTFKNGEVQDVEIPIKVIKNIYEAKTLTERPYYVPETYKAVTLDPTTKAKDPQKTYFYVNPDANVVIPGSDPEAINGYKFINWTIPEKDANGNVIDVRYILADRHQFKEETTIKANYTGDKDIIPFDPNEPTARPEGYVLVRFEAEAGLKLAESKAYFIKKGALDSNGAALTLAAVDKPSVNAAAGYAFDSWDKKDITVINNGDIVVTAKVKQGEKPVEPGRPDDRPSYPEVIYRDKIVEKEKIVEKIVKVGDNDELLKEIRYMQGFNGKFRPYDGLTRAEAAQILANALKADGYRYDANYALSYSDVGSKWYTDAVRVVTQANVFQGYSDGTFRPQGKITRAEWVATLRRFQDLKKASGNTMMLRSGHWATEEVEAAYQAGWLGVYQDGTAKFDADKPITRQEVAYVSNRAFRRVLDKIYLKRSVNTLLTYKDINPSMPLYEDILCASNTLLTDGRYYKANTIVMDNVTFNIVTDYLRISQKKFQYNVIR